MKWIIYWLALMIILPLLFLFWWKKRWRLLIGFIILVVLVISYLAPGEIAYLRLKTETEKEKPIQQLENSLRSISDDEPNPSDPEKLKLEKLISKAQKKIEKEWKEATSEEEKYRIIMKNYGLNWQKVEWIRKWGKKENAPTFLFCGEEFNEGLSREGKNFGGGNWRTVKSQNTIDFGQSENNKLDSVKKKLQEICEQNENDLMVGNSPIIWLKNIDKITNSELKNELTKIVDPSQNSDLGKYYQEIKENNKTERKEKTIDLSQFTLVATTSSTNPKLAPELRAKLKPIEPFFDKYFWIIFFSAAGAEIIIFLLLIRSWRKSKNKSLKQLEY